MSDYGTPIYIETGNAVNFNPADGVNTIFVAGKMSNSYTGKGDYFIYSEDNVSITSRWFILEADRTRNGQYRLQLHRDVIVDNYNAVLTAKSLIKKATVNDDSVLIWNKEPMSVNQIKAREYLLKDDTFTAWIVGYVARGMTEDKQLNLNPSFIIPDITVTSIDNWDYAKYINSDCVGKGSGIAFDFCTYLTDDDVSNIYRNFKYYQKGDFAQGTMYSDSFILDKMDENFKTEVINKVINNSNLYRPYTPNVSDYNKLTSFSNKVIYSTTEQKYYKITAKITQNVTPVLIDTDKNGDELLTWLKNKFRNKISWYSEDRGGTIALPFRIVYNYPSVTITLSEMTYSSCRITFPKDDNRLHLKDAPYDMFAIPYSDLGTFHSGSVYLKNNASYALAIANELVRNLGSYIYDVQLLPYCPFTGYTMTGSGNVFQMTLDTSDTRRLTAVNDDNGKPILYMVWCTASSGRKYISLEEPITIKNKKVSNQCEMYRIVSPNYNGQFEFNLARNNIESLSNFILDFTYMPYNPYIHISPTFDGLYGQDYGDSRGLICQGDFSLASVSDAWVQYQIQNKNYQNIFNREIAQMDKTRNYERIEESISAVAGSFQTSAQGFMVGGGWGAAIGGTLGLAAGIGDVAISESKYQANKAYKKDIFNLQLDNVKALPYSLSKTTAFTANNKIFPIVEYYTASYEEKDIFAETIAATGMTCNSLGQIVNYITNSWSYNNIKDRGYIEADIIYIDIEDDTHMANAISEELQKGVYFK